MSGWAALGRCWPTRSRSGPARKPAARCSAISSAAARRRRSTGCWPPGSACTRSRRCTTRRSARWWRCAAPTSSGCRSSRPPASSSWSRPSATPKPKSSSANPHPYRAALGLRAERSCAYTRLRVLESESSETKTRMRGDQHGQTAEDQQPAGALAAHAADGTADVPVRDGHRAPPAGQGSGDQDQLGFALHGGAEPGEVRLHRGRGGRPGGQAAGADHLSDHRCGPRRAKGLAALEAANAEHQAGLDALVTQVPRLFLIESEYHLALRRAEAEWVRGLLKEFTAGSFPGIKAWQLYHDTGKVPDEVLALVEAEREGAADS